MSLINKIGMGITVVSGLGLVGTVASCEYHQKRAREYEKDVGAINVTFQQIQNSLSDLESRYHKELESHGFNHPTAWLCNEVKRLEPRNVNGLKFCAGFDEFEPVLHQYWSQQDNLRSGTPRLMEMHNNYYSLSVDHRSKALSQSLLGLFFLCMTLTGMSLSITPSRRKEDEENKPETKLNTDLENKQ
ncbi:MAG: hypothetical protein AABW48_04675 [Nanoarchaeota archaeon]